MTLTGILIIIVVVAIGITFLSFGRALNKDRDDLQGMSLERKFQVMVDMINQEAFNGKGSTRQRSWREFNLYKQDENQIINFNYSTGHLTITWKYKYYQIGTIYSKQFDHVRNITPEKQRELTKRFIEEAAIQIQQHKRSVLKEMDSTGRW